MAEGIVAVEPKLAAMPVPVLCLPQSATKTTNKRGRFGERNHLELGERLDEVRFLREIWL